MYGRRSASFAAALALSAIALSVVAQGAAAASRAPLRDLLAAPSRSAAAFDSAARPRPAAVRALTRHPARRSSATERFEIATDHYGTAELESVAATLRSLDHGPELAQLVVYVATREEIGEACGADVVACYVPSEREMVVSGVDRPVAGVPRDFAIAHEYGHHIANSQRDRDPAGAGTPSSLEAGTLRWATYERVCQLTRRGRLFPGNQNAHYWQNPEEAFAQSYAQLNRPGAGVGWQYTPLLRPSTAALAKIHADVARPWAGPTETTWSGSVLAAPAATATASARAGTAAIGAAHAVGDVPWAPSHLLRTPLDGPVSVTLRAAPGSRLSVALRDPVSNRTLARAGTDAAGEAHLAYANCGHASLRLEVRSAAAPTGFDAAITRP